MRREEFDIVLKREGEQHAGRLLLQIEDAEVSGCITLEERQSYFQGKALRKDRYTVSLRLQAGAWIEDCDALLLARSDGALSGVFLGPWQSWTLSGARVPARV